jgi:hypothetical protein
MSSSHHEKLRAGNKQQAANNRRQQANQTATANAVKTTDHSPLTIDYWLCNPSFPFQPAQIPLKRREQFFLAQPRCLFLGCAQIFNCFLPLSRSRVGCA